MYTKPRMFLLRCNEYVDFFWHDSLGQKILLQSSQRVAVRHILIRKLEKLLKFKDVVVKFSLQYNYLRCSGAVHATELVRVYHFTSVRKTAGAGKLSFSSSSPTEYQLEWLQLVGMLH